MNAHTPGRVIFFHYDPTSGGACSIEHCCGAETFGECDRPGLTHTLMVPFDAVTAEAPAMVEALREIAGFWTNGARLSPDALIGEDVTIGKSVSAILARIDVGR